MPTAHRSDDRRVLISDVRLTAVRTDRLWIRFQDGQLRCLPRSGNDACVFHTRGPRLPNWQELNLEYEGVLSTSLRLALTLKIPYCPSSQANLHAMLNWREPEKPPQPAETPQDPEAVERENEARLAESAKRRAHDQAESGPSAVAQLRQDSGSWPTDEDLLAPDAEG